MKTEESKVFTSHAPKTDLYDGNPVGVYAKSGAGDRVRWFLQQITAGTNTGTATVTVLSAADSSGTSAAAVPFRYRKKTTGTSSDLFGTLFEVSASGFVTTANENTIYEIEVEASSLDEGRPWVALRLTETVNDPVTGAVIGIVENLRYAGQGSPTALA